MARLWQFWQGHRKPAFSEKVQREAQEKFFKNRPKGSPSLKGPKALWRKWHYPLISMHLKCKDWRWFWRKKRLQNPARMAELLQFSQGHPKPSFSEKVQRGDQKKFFKNRPKSKSRLKAPKALWRKWNYPLISMHLKCQEWRWFRCKNRLQMCPNGQVMAIFARSPKTRIFWKSAKGRAREIFQVMAYFARSPKTRIFWKSARGGLREMFQKSSKK